jgi:regulatory protein
MKSLVKGGDMEITFVEKSKKNEDKLLIHIDGTYAFSISEEDYLSLNLYEKREITAEEIDHIQNVLNFRQAKSGAIRFLAMKVRTEKEVRTRLETEGFDRETIESAVEELRGIGYINDRMYAQKFLYDRSKLKPKAKKMIKYELMNKGISEEIANEVLSDWQVDESAVAEGLVRKKFGKYDLNDEKIIKRIYAFLHHRGFSFQLIDSLVKQLGE